MNESIDKVVPRAAFLRSLESFLHVEAAGGVVLLLASIVALLWANSTAGDTYAHLWHTPLVVQMGDWRVEQSLHFIINDCLMTVFFLVVGLEIRREIHGGALSNLRLATLPVFAACGGVLLPAGIYLALNRTPELQHGWAVPTATDIAFAVGVLALLGKRVPASLRVLLLALAIIDDIIAILIIALFYSDGVQPMGFALAVVGLAFVFVFQGMGFRSAWSYVLPGAVVWFGVWQAQVHPAIAGVVLGLVTPVQRVASRERLAHVADHLLTQFRDGEAQTAASQLGNLQREMQAPVDRVQSALHPWVAYGIMPLFALANSGVSLAGISVSTLAHETISLGIVLGLCLGKPIGITLASLAAIRLRIAALPDGATVRGLILVGCLGGIGFTMAIFIANLAFDTPEHLAQAKLAILAASAISGVVGLAAGRLLLR